MTAEIATLASTAAGQMVSLLTSDSWAWVKTAVPKLWRGTDSERVAEELARARVELLGAQRDGGLAELRLALAAEWQARLIRLLTAHPDSVEDLHALIAAEPFTTVSTGPQTLGAMTLTAHVTGGGSAYMAGRDLTVERREPQSGGGTA